MGNLIKIFIRDYLQVVALVVFVLFTVQMLSYLKIGFEEPLSFPEMLFLGALTSLTYDAVRLFIRRFL